MYPDVASVLFFFDNLHTLSSILFKNMKTCYFYNSMFFYNFHYFFAKLYAFSNKNCFFIIV